MSDNMSKQVTVRLPDDLNQALDLAAKRLMRKRSEVLRMALAQFLEPESGAGGQPAKRVHHLLGSLESGMPDLAENHRRYVLESLRREP